MRRPIVSKSERSGTGVDMANLSKAVCHGESDKCRFGNPPQESNSQRLVIKSGCGARHMVLEVSRKGSQGVGLKSLRICSFLLKLPRVSYPAKASAATRDAK